MLKIQIVLISAVVSAIVSLLVSRFAAKHYLAEIDRYVENIFGDLKEIAKLIDCGLNRKGK